MAGHHGGEGGETAAGHGVLHAFCSMQSFEGVPLAPRLCSLDWARASLADGPVEGGFMGRQGGRCRSGWQRVSRSRVEVFGAVGISGAGEVIDLVIHPA